MPLLDKIKSPADLRALKPAELAELAAEIRASLVTHVGRTGGHLGSNLGVVELTIALHRVFDSPKDPIIFDTGHQSYVHKMLTGRADRFDTLRQAGGLSGYPSRAESEHDWVENSHASTALSWAEGIARAFNLQGQTDRKVVAVVGDGALTGGMAWEALNNIAADDLPIVIVVNDNGRSYQPTVGGLAKKLSGIRTDPRYERTMRGIGHVARRMPRFGETAYTMLEAFRAGLTRLFFPQSMFSDLGIKYIGPFDGHDLKATEKALRQAKRVHGPVIVHAITRKGNGVDAAENDRERFHAVDHLDEATGERVPSSCRTWTDAFSDDLLSLATERPKVVALTAAMLGPTGLGAFAERFPHRVFDVGIAEQHAVTAAAGMAAAGLHPVVAVYSTFLSRAFDQMMMDVGLHQAGVTFVLDRAGVTGPDGSSHHGQWDVALAGLVPGLRFAAPRDRKRLTQALTTALDWDGPAVLRFPKGPVPDDREPVEQIDGLDVMAHGEREDVLIVAYGDMVPVALEAASMLPMGVTVVDPVWALPVADSLVKLVAKHHLVVSVEDDTVVGGFGQQLRLAMERGNVDVPVRCLGMPSTFLPAGTREQVLSDAGLDADGVIAAVTAAWASTNAG